jgi:hypothetical protein
MNIKKLKIKRNILKTLTEDQIDGVVGGTWYENPPPPNEPPDDYGQGGSPHPLDNGSSTTNSNCSSC